MSKDNTQLKGPWKSIHSAIWLIGLAILFWKGWWWPGILVLIALSALVQGAIQIMVPEAVEEMEGAGDKPEAPQPAPVETPKPAVATPAVHPTQRLPSECPKCSAPIRGAEVHWTGPESADCPYCGTNLPLKPASHQ
jgi:hypothetical protein